MQRSPSFKSSPSFLQPLDRVAIVLLVVLLVLIGLLLWGGDRTAPRVRDFTWQNKQVGADDTAFILGFSRPMDHASVEKNLKIDPPLPGKVSWAGRRMAYTLTLPATYGSEYQVRLENAQDYFTQKGSQRAPIQPFQTSFRTRDRAFAYIGTQGEETGRLVLDNLTKQEHVILTSADFVVNQFKPYPLGDRILIAATPRAAQAQGILEQKLYRVATGIQVESPPAQVGAQTDGNPITAFPIAAAGTTELVLDSTAYQNLKFDLSADGKVIVVQRVSRTDPADFGPWILRDGKPPEALQGQPGGDFLITPDSDSLAIAQGQGLAVLPLQPNAAPLNFLPKFGIVLAFSRDGSLAAMVKFNTDRTRSLFLVTNQGIQKELVRTTGSIFAAQFDPAKQILYSLLSELISGETYQENPYLAAIDLKTTKLTPLVDLPNQRDIQFSLAPDGLAILYDQTTAPPQSDAASSPNQAGKSIATSKLWLLPINTASPTSNLKPEPLPFAGIQPRWLP
ncbi:Ig-like domain-containing protein [Leptolyngbyaceae cyanobacterium UHCC 1019]